MGFIYFIYLFFYFIFFNVLEYWLPSRDGSGNFGKGGRAPHANAGKIRKVYFCAEGAQKMEIRMSNKRFRGIWDQIEGLIICWKKN